MLAVVLTLFSSQLSQAADLDPKRTCDRIVSLAPSITEIVYALDLEQAVIGVTKFCRYPEAAKKVPKIGGFLDINTELVFASRPSVVFALRESEAATRALARLGVRVVTVNHDTIGGIKSSIEVIGQECGRIDAAHKLIDQLNREEQRLAATISGAAQLSALIVVGRTNEGSETSGVYVSGKDGFYSEVLDLLKIKNVNSRQTVALPTVSIEGISALNPDIVIEIVNVDDAVVPTALSQYWKQFPGLKAVQKNRVFFFTEDFASIPGPRYIQMAQALAYKVYPERFPHADQYQ